MEHILEARFRSILAEEGWAGPTDFHWSLGYCQGDGVAFFGRVDDAIALIRRLVPVDLANPLAIPFAGPEASGTIIVTKQRYGPGLPFMAVDAEVGDCFEPADDDTGHLTIQKQIGADALDLLERALQEDVKRVATRLSREAYAMLEAADPTWWSSLNAIETRSGRYVVLRRISMSSIAVEWRLMKAELDCCDTEDAEWWSATLASGAHACSVACVLLDPDEEELFTSSLCTMTLPAKGWEKSEDLNAVMRDLFDEVKEEARASRNREIAARTEPRQHLACV